MNDEKEWIESPDGWGPTHAEIDDEEGVGVNNAIDLFADTDPRQSFEFRIAKSDAADAEDTVRIAGFKLDSDEAAMSTGATLWDGSHRLAAHLRDRGAADYIHGRRVLELGAGLGLVGIVASRLGARVVLTDADTRALGHMRENVRRNGCDGAVRCQQLFWGDPHHTAFRSAYGTFETVVAADVIYNPKSIGPLFDTVAALMQKPHGRFLLSWFTRVNDVSVESVLQAAELRHLEWSETEDGIYIFMHRKDGGVR